MPITTELQTTQARSPQMPMFAAWLRTVTDPVIHAELAESPDDIDGDELLRRLREAGL